MRTVLIALTILTGVVELMLVVAVLMLRAPGRQDARQIWELELADMSTGRRQRCRFRGRLNLGRTTSPEQREGWMFLGGNPTISRWQCCLSVGQGSVWISNTSQVNVSRCNGRMLDSPRRLYEGDFLKLGDANYCVTQLYRVA